jgi:hypothetical protein
VKILKEAVMKSHKIDIVLKTIMIIAFLCIILALIIIIITPPAAGYEISIYNAFPWYLWLLIIVSIFLGQMIVFIDIFYNSPEENNRMWFIGIIAIMIPVIILLFLTYIRGYPIYGRGDHLTHIGWIKGIIDTGTIQKSNFYPDMHILAASLTEICGCNVYDTANFMPRFFFFLSPISLYLFLKIIFNKKNEIKLAIVLFSSVLFFAAFATYFAQYYQSFLFTPLILYLYFKRGISKNVFAFSILFIILIVSYNFYHPINSLLLTFVFLIILFILYLLPRMMSEDYKINFVKTLIKDKSLNALLIISLLFFLWYFSFSYIIGSFYQVFSSIFYNTDVSFIQSQVSIVNTYKPQMIDLLRLLILNYGVFLIITLISFVYLLYFLLYTIIKRYRDKQRFKFTFNFLFFGLAFLLFSFISAAGILANLIVGWQRFAGWAYFFSIAFISPAIYIIIMNNKIRIGFFKFYTKTFKIVILSIILISLVVISTISLYRSPINGDTNLQVTAMELKGMEWILHHRNNKIFMDQLGIDQQRYSDAIYTYNLSLSEIIRKNVVVPDHFTYNNKTSLGLYYKENRYLMIAKLGKIFYPEMYPNYKNHWRFNPEDFDKLQSDNAEIKIYVNGDFEAYFHKSNKN